MSRAGAATVVAKRTVMAARRTGLNESLPLRGHRASHPKHSNHSPGVLGKVGRRRRLGNSANQGFGGFFFSSGRYLTGSARNRRRWSSLANNRRRPRWIVEIPYLPGFKIPSSTRLTGQFVPSATSRSEKDLYSARNRSAFS